MPEPVPPCFLSHFSALRDPRQATEVLYPLPEILLLILCATIAGADDFVEIGLWGTEHHDFLRRFLPYDVLLHGAGREHSKSRGGVDVVGVGSGLTGRGLAWCRRWCGG
jgi:hypothetical protein